MKNLVILLVFTFTTSICYGQFFPGGGYQGGSHGSGGDETCLTTPSNIQISHDVTNVTITWDPVPYATDYQVYYSYDPYAGFTAFPTTTGGATTYTDVGGALEGKKFYYVTAVKDNKTAYDKVKTTSK